MAEDAPLAANLLKQLQAADQWLKILVEQFDVEPEETTFVVDVVGKDDERNTVARTTLADSMFKIAAAIEAGQIAMKAGHA